jgi:hypothetical protein
MTTRSRLSSGVRTLCGSPPDAPVEAGGLPEYVIYEVLTDVESSMLIDINLSDQNRRVQSKSVSLQSDGYDFAVNSSSLSVPSFAQIRYGTDAWQEPVDIVNLASVDRAAQDGRLAVAFYGTPLRARLSWMPQSGENNTLTLWFDRTIDGDGALTDEPAIEDAYTVHMKLQAAAQCLELMNKPVGDVLKVRIAKGEDQWKKYVRMNGQQGVVRKSSSHPRAGRRRSEFQRPGGGWL